MQVFLLFSAVVVGILLLLTLKERFLCPKGKIFVPRFKVCDFCSQLCPGDLEPGDLRFSEQGESFPPVLTLGCMFSSTDHRAG